MKEEKQDKYYIPIEKTESFPAMIRKGNSEGVKVITIPFRVCEFLGLTDGNDVKVWIKKITKEE